MKSLKITIIGLMLSVISGCGTKSEYINFSVSNVLEKDTVRVVCVYRKTFLPQDSTLRYCNIYLPPQLQLLPDYNSRNKKGVVTKTLEMASISFPEYRYEIIFKENTVTYIIPPLVRGSLGIERKDIEHIVRIIDKIIIYNECDTVAYYTPESIATILQKSKNGKGDICIQVDSTMLKSL